MKPTKEATLTHESHDYVKPGHPKPTKEATLGDKSHNYVEPAPKHSQHKQEHHPSTS